MKIRPVEKIDRNIGDWFVIGKVYVVSNGIFHDEQGGVWGYTTIEKLNDTFKGVYRFELVEDEPSTPTKPTKPTKEQLANLKPGDKVRLRSDRGSIWAISGAMDKFCDKIVTIREIHPNAKSFHITEEEWHFLLEDIVEIISPEPIKEPVKEPVKPAKPWKESLIDQINQLPFEGGIISISVCERERARIIELINAM